MTLWEIKTTVVSKYKDGNDWIYPKTKKAEVEIIKSLLEISDKLSNENYDLQEQLNAINEWDAYEKAEYELDKVRGKFERMSTHIDSYSAMREQWEEAKKVLGESEEYMQEIARKIDEENA